MALNSHADPSTRDPELTGLFDRYRNRIYRCILHMVRDPVEAEDLTQETFLRAYLHRASLQDPHALSAWLYRIATHVCYDRWRQSSRRSPLLSLDALNWERHVPLVDDQSPTLDQLIEQAEMSACVQRFLDRLSDDYRTVILLHDLEGLTGTEVARMLGTSLGTVKIRLHRARRKLKAALAAGCDFSHDERGVLVCEPTAPAPQVPSSGSPSV